MTLLKVSSVMVHGWSPHRNKSGKPSFPARYIFLRMAKSGLLIFFKCTSTSLFLLKFECQSEYQSNFEFLTTSNPWNFIVLAE